MLSLKPLLPVLLLLMLGLLLPLWLLLLLLLLLALLLEMLLLLQMSGASCSSQLFLCPRCSVGGLPFLGAPSTRATRRHWTPGPLGAPYTIHLSRLGAPLVGLPSLPRRLREFN